jgi:hypothetical protein
MEKNLGHSSARIFKLQHERDQDPGRCLAIERGGPIQRAGSVRAALGPFRLPRSRSDAFPEAMPNLQRVVFSKQSAIVSIQATR